MGEKYKWIPIIILSYPGRLVAQKRAEARFNIIFDNISPIN